MTAKNRTGAPPNHEGEEQLVTSVRHLSNACSQQLGLVYGTQSWRGPAHRLGWDRAARRAVPSPFVQKDMPPTASQSVWARQAG